MHLFIVFDRTLFISQLTTYVRPKGAWSNDVGRVDASCVADELNCGCH